ncbi:MAG: 4Fe-4S binding protein [Gammaproteobacteria bacterium]|jgi:NAD(P)H-flavin reductase|nr:4Fe-4S binding protein [Gammaproteobacteria bacterium]MBT7603461.1 4Fe-4S binding protein [Gammaproteobacteria bacterium]
MSSASNFIYPRNGVPHSKSKVNSAPNPDVQISRVKINNAVVKSMENLTEDTYRVVVKCNDNALPFNSHAGQYATLKVEGLKKPRAFSFAKSPKSENKNEYSFFIRQVPGGEFSAWLDKNRTGENIIISAPLGTFKIDDSSDDMICIAGGSGMSAVNSIVEEAVHLKVKRNCYFFYGARTQKDLYLVKELSELSKVWSKGYKFEFIPVLSEEPENSDWKGARGFVTDHFKKEYLEKGIVSADSCKAFFCGPPPMIDAGAKVLAEAGVSEKSMFFDKFEDARSPAPVIDNSKCILCDECLLVKPTKGCIVETSKLGKIKDNGKYADIQRIDPAYTSGLYYNTLYIDEDECIRCYACVHACPAKAISPEYELEPKTLRDMVES